MKHSVENQNGSIVDYGDAVIFDMEGVFLNGGSTPDQFYLQTANEHLGEDVVEELVENNQYRTVLWPDDIEEYRDICRVLNVDPEDFWRRKEESVEELEIQAINENERQLVDGSVETFRDLSEDYELGVVSNNTDGVVKRVVESNDLDKYFTSYRGLENSLEGFQSRKPDPFYINEVLDDLDADSGIYVGDRVTDMEAAEKAGLKGVYVGSEPPKIAEVSITHIGELPDIL